MSQSLLEEDEGIPSSGIWDPSMGGTSSASSIASYSSHNSESSNSSKPKAVSVEGNPTDAKENELRLRIYETQTSTTADETSFEEEDQNGLGAMLTSTISQTHGSSTTMESGSEFPSIEKAKKSKRSKDSSSRSEDRLVPSNPSKQLKDERKKFIMESLSHLSDKQLRIQLFDSFRLARVILGKPIRDKKCKLSHNSILHAIRTVAEMKIQILNMTEELEGYRRREQKRQRKKKKKSKQEESLKDTDTSKGEVDTAKPELSNLVEPETPATEDTEKESKPKSSLEREGSSSSMRQQAIELLQQESDLALDQLQELEQQQQTAKENLLSPQSATSENPLSPASLFLSRSFSSSDTDDDSTTFQLPSPINDESAAQILYAFGGANATSSPKESPIDLPNPEVIRAVLKKVIALEEQQQTATTSESIPESTTVDATRAASHSSAVHQEVIALLAQLAKGPNTPKKPMQSALEITVPITPQIEDSSPSKDLPSTKLEPKEVASSSDATKLSKFESEVGFLELQKEILREDIALAKKNTTPNRTELQLERLYEYQGKAHTLLQTEEERTQQIATLDHELTELAELCITLEDSETAFREKHKYHLTTLREFGNQSRIHTERFQELLANIQAGIKEQRSKIFGSRDEDDKPEFVVMTNDPSVGVNETDERIRRLKFMLTRRDAELFKANARIKLLQANHNG